MDHDNSEVPSEVTAWPSRGMPAASARSLVVAVYRSLLLREPDEVGLADWSRLLAAGEIDLETMLRRTLAGEEFAERSADFMMTYVAPTRSRLTNDVSQFGETWLVLRDIVNRAAKHRIVVDVGARGRERSNSYDLMRHLDWRGILVEANPGLIPSINAEFSGLNYRLINCAVSDYSGTATFFLGVNDDVSSLTHDAAQGWGAVQGEVEVKVERLSRILGQHGIPHDFDLLSIDAEGEDINILNEVVQAGYLPAYIVIEASNDYRTKSLTDLPVTAAVSERYAIVEQTRANLILRRR